MADSPEGGTFGFLTRKAGPLPIGVWLAIGLGVWYYFDRKNASSTAATTDSGIDPVTGEPYSQELGAADQQLADQGSSSTSSGSTTGGAYTDNNSWAQAAINYLVARGVDPTQANQAIELYLTSQTLTSAQQADVNLAIQGIGPPPDIPGPASTAPGQVVTPPTGTGSTGTGTGTGVTETAPPPAPGTGTYTPQPGQPGAAGNPSAQPTSYPAPTGLASSGVTSTGYHLSWNAVTGPHGEKPTGYTIATYQMNGKKVDQFTASGTSASEYGSGGTGLTPGYQYRTDVWANGGQQAPPHASTVVTLKTK